MKEDERAFLLKLSAERPRQVDGPFATDVALALGIPIKRAEYILKKWTDKDWWDYGVSLRTGWLTEEGLQAAKVLNG